MMNKNELRAYFSDKKGAEETFPFGETTLVFKVMGKMFGLLPLDTSENDAPRLNLKCDPIHAEILRQTYDAIIPGYHMNKKHWNTIICNGTIPKDEIYEMIDNSYDLVVRNLKKADRKKLKGL